MEDRESNLEYWVEERLAVLAPPAGWQPDSARAYAAMHNLDGAMKRRRRKRLLLAAAFGAASLAALLVEAPKAYCAGAGCANQPVSHQPSLQPKPQPSLQPKPQPAPAQNFRQSGAANAPITCEIYSDYACPACANAFRDVLPLLMLNYVQTGKVRLVHRDFPLPVHRYSRLAARYANAAGLVGEYEAAVAQIFRTQAAWTSTGEIDAQLTHVLSPGAMQTIRQLVNGDATLDGDVAADIAQGREDQIASTPTFVIVTNGHREKIPPGSSYELLKSYLDGLLKAQ